MPRPDGYAWASDAYWTEPVIVSEDTRAIVDYVLGRLTAFLTNPAPDQGDALQVGCDIEQLGSIIRALPTARHPEIHNIYYRPLVQKARGAQQPRLI